MWKKTITNELALELFSLLRDTEVYQLHLRKAFLKDRTRFRREVERAGIDLADVSVRAGYKPDTAATIISNAMVKQERYNFKTLAKLMAVMEMTPTFPLNEYPVEDDESVQNTS